MFIPLGFEHSYERRPLATIGLIAANVLVFALCRPAGDGGYGGYELDPENFRLYQFVTSSFLHADFLHLAGNMLFLWPFGRYVEDRLGAWRFALLYLACGVAGDLLYLASGDERPSIGASGAMSGLMGYVLVAAPWLEMRFIFALGFYYSGSYELAVAWLLVPWAGLQLLMASIGESDVGYLAHLGGFCLGAAAAAVMRSRWCLGTPWYIDPRPPEGGRAAIDRLRRARGKGVAQR